VVQNMTGDTYLPVYIVAKIISSKPSRLPSLMVLRLILVAGLNLCEEK